MNTKKIAWAAFVLVVLYFHLMVGTLLAIATAFYWLLERHLIGKSSVQTDNPPERLWCVIGEHWIGNEPYSFYPETERHTADEAYCLKCKEGSKLRIDQLLKEIEEQKAKEIEWEQLTEEERESRRSIAKARGTCPRCEKMLWLHDSDAHSKGSCPMCYEFPFRIGAPMNRGWREREWVSLSESEKQRRFDAAVKKSGWRKDSDGVWRRGDETIDEARLIEMAQSRWGDPLYTPTE